VAPGPPICVLLLPRTLDGFLLRDQAEDLLRAPGVVAVQPGRVPYGAWLRLPGAVGRRLARAQARRVLERLDGVPRVVAIFHPVQEPVASALCDLVPGCELWYGRWDRYELAYDAGPRRRRRLERLHEAAARRSALTFAVSGELARLEHDAGREATVVPLSADAFPAPDPDATVVAVSLGHLGWRTDWALLRDVAAELPGLVLLLVGAWHEGEVGEDPAFRACRALPQLVWLGPRSDEEAARLIACADVGIVPFRVEPFNDAGLPYRILKYARLGRRTVSPPLAGVRTWAEVVDVADGPQAFAAALRAQAGTRTRPHAEVRRWALAQTARAQNAPLRRRLQEVGIDAGS
jgi:glycosyltransferase involved in cell wall biosynthesis